MDEGELRLALVDHLTSAEVLPAGMVLLVDEAHALPLRLLDEIRVLGHVVHGGDARVRIVLAGGPLLEERLASPKLESLSQGLAARCYLEALNRCETEDYVHAQIDKAGGRGSELIPPDACQSVYQATDGVPRLVNHVCDHVLLLAYAAGRSVIRPEHVEEAWADLQQLPTPWNGEGKKQESAGNLVEFGGLDDEPEATGGPALPAPACDVPDTAGSDVDGAPSQTSEVFETSEVFPAGGTPARSTLPRAGGANPADRDLDFPSGRGRDFQPTGPDGPEVEMVIEDFGNPFGEPFEEEEPVVDRYTGRDEARETGDGGRGAGVEGSKAATSGRDLRDEGRGMRDEGPESPAMPERRQPRFGQLFARLRGEAASR